MKAEQFLRQGADVLAERGKEYDKPEGERSMSRCVTAFNSITGKDLTEAEGWAFMAILKMVRQWQNPGRYHADSAIDGVNYSALMAEALSEQECDLANGCCETMSFGGKPDWKDAPEWANVLVCGRITGEYEWAQAYANNAAVTDDLHECGGEYSFSSDFADHWRLVESRP